MNVLILGSGGREHTMAWKIAQSKLLSNLYIAPGNAGTSQLGTNLDVSVNDFKSIKEIALKYKITLVVVGPEDPLVKGIRNYFEEDDALKHIPVIGPDKVGAQLEGSKEFAKEFMVKYKIPTAAYGSFTLETLNEANHFLEKMKAPYVLKADGLAAGKGVLIIDDLVEAKTALKIMLEGQFGPASRKVVIEEFLSGIEVSYFIVTDGDNYLLLPEAKDYKRIGEKDTGLNTGGMGAISPIPFADKEFTQKVIDRIIEPTVHGLKAEGIHYQGFIFFGLIKVDNEPVVIEYNARMGDPETEVVLPRIDADFLEILAAIPTKSLKKVPFAIKPETAVTVMMVSGGYPGDYEKGKTMTGFNQITNSLAFHAGTTTKNNQIVTNGGRVLAITSMGNNRQQALELSYKNAELIKYENRYFRRDIGFDL
jgi:phosphoribosylamine--glycine ligase